MQSNTSLFSLIIIVSSHTWKGLRRKAGPRSQSGESGVYLRAIWEPFRVFQREWPGQRNSLVGFVEGDPREPSLEAEH